MMFKSIHLTFTLFIAVFQSLSQCNSLSVNDLILLGNTPNRQIMERFLYERDFTFKERKIHSDSYVYQYVSVELGLMVEYSEAIVEDELLSTINLFLREKGKDSFLKDLKENGWMKYKEEFLDPYGWINQAFINPKLPAYPVIYGRINDQGVKYYRVIL